MLQPDAQRLRLSALTGFLAVGLGAMGAHGPVHAKLVSLGELDHWQTAVSYHLPHSILLVVLALAAGGLRKGGAWAWTCIFAGILLFSGSLYVLAYFEPKSWPARWLTGIIIAATPLGGLSLMTGWLLLALSRWRHE